jgi:glycosyltransferase involved in cell wall biosynthesis
VSGKVLNQVTTGATVGDAITDQVFALQRWLRELGFTSFIYAEHIHPALRAEVRPVESYRPLPGENWLIFHHSIGSPVADRLARLPLKLILIYHNVTPPEYFTATDPVLAQEMILGRRQLQVLRPRTGLALGVSSYNADELRAAGFNPVAVLPLSLDENQYSYPVNDTLRTQLSGPGPRLLFVGRLVPNKKQEDLVKLLYYYRRFRPEAKLLLVGNPWVPDYAHWLRDLIRDLKQEDAVHLVGQVSQPDLTSYYRLADLFVSMSEHEGFGKPLIESMYLGLPILAYASAGVPGTLGDAGVMFRHKCFEALAELVDLLCYEAALRERVLAGQAQRVQAFIGPVVRRQWQTYLEQIGL